MQEVGRVLGSGGKAFRAGCEIKTFGLLSWQPATVDGQKYILMVFGVLVTKCKNPLCGERDTA